MASRGKELMKGWLGAGNCNGQLDIEQSLEIQQAKIRAEHGWLDVELMNIYSQELRITMAGLTQKRAHEQLARSLEFQWMA